MSKIDIWMPVYIGDYLRDTLELSAEEHGAYLLLLMHYWLKDGEIGSDIDRLSRVAKTNPETCRFILGYYFTLENGNYKNKRADEEMENAENRRSASAENGKKGGRPPINNLEKTHRLILGNLGDNLDETYTEPRSNLQKSSSSSSSSSSSESSEEEYKRADKPPRASFQKPTLDEVAEYCKARGSVVSPSKWMAHYESNGWKVGKNSMKDWRAAVRTWEPDGHKPPAPKRVCKKCGQELFDGGCRNLSCPECPLHKEP